MYENLLSMRVLIPSPTPIFLARNAPEENRVGDGLLLRSVEEPGVEATAERLSQAGGVVERWNS